MDITATSKPESSSQKLLLDPSSSTTLNPKPISTTTTDHQRPAAAGGDKLKRDEWSDGAVSSLLEAYEAKWVLRNRAKLKGLDWEEVARFVSDRAEAPKTQTQCKNKIESMKKRYPSESSSAFASGGRSTWPLNQRIHLLLSGGGSISRPAAHHHPQQQQITVAASSPSPGTTTTNNQLALMVDAVHLTGQPPVQHTMVHHQSPAPVVVQFPIPAARHNASAHHHQIQKNYSNYESNNGEAAADAAFRVTRLNSQEDGGVGGPNRYRLDPESDNIRVHEEKTTDTDSNSASTTPAAALIYSTDRAGGKLRRSSSSDRRNKNNAGAMIMQKKRRSSGAVVIAESIRWLAEAVLSSEQARMETMRELEKMRAEAEVRRAEIELQRTQIIANTQLQIAALLSGKPAATTGVHELTTSSFQAG